MDPSPPPVSSPSHLHHDDVRGRMTSPIAETGQDLTSRSEVRNLAFLVSAQEPFHPVFVFLLFPIFSVKLECLLQTENVLTIKWPILAAKTEKSFLNEEKSLV